MLHIPVISPLYLPHSTPLNPHIRKQLGPSSAFISVPIPVLPPASATTRAQTSLSRLVPVCFFNSSLELPFLGSLAKCEMRNGDGFMMDL